MDWDTHLLHTVDTLVANMGPRGLTGQPTVLEQTLTVEGASMQVWRQAGYHGQDALEEPAGATGGRGRGRGGRGWGLIKHPFVVPHAPDPATCAPLTAPATPATLPLDSVPLRCTLITLVPVPRCPAPRESYNTWPSRSATLAHSRQAAHRVWCGQVWSGS